MFLRLSVSWMLIKQQNTEQNHFCSFNTDLLDFIYTVKTMKCYFSFDLFNLYTWILLDLPEEYKALFISCVSFFYYI